jgi:endonuclease/exonuclease/phosphatase family metal-dependent hydrolase
MKGSWLKTSWLGKLILLVNLVFAAMLLASYLATLVPPDQFWPLVFAGLSYPFLLVINIVFVITWVLRRRLYFLLSLGVILLGYGNIGRTFQWNPGSTDAPENAYVINVASYNVRVFDLYNYKPNWQPDYTNRNNIFRILEAKDFDIICFQEFVHDRSGIFKTLDTLPQLLRARHAHFGYSKSSRNINFFGLATFSAYPIVNKGRVDFHSNAGNLCIYTDIKINDDTIRVYNVHFESIGLSPEDYLFMETILSPPDQHQLSEGGRRILRRIKLAAEMRAPQARIVAGHVSQSPYPVILAGDFNDTPVSYVYRQVSKNLEDAFKSGHGFGQTYVGAFPSFRIDYILHSPQIKSMNYTTGDRKYSDHYPIYTSLALPATD